MPIGYPISFYIKVGSVPEANEHITEIKKKYPDAKIHVEVNKEGSGMDCKTSENAFALEVMEHYGHSFESMAERLRETGCGFDFLIGRTKDAEASIGGVVDIKPKKQQKVIIDFHPDYDYFLIRKIRPAPGETQETPGASEN